ncbi:MAG TPA: PAS domain S-box protein [Nitrospirota bacterium]|nr:PAS domain S-box protein [Nitrospirota bacterium]
MKIHKRLMFLVAAGMLVILAVTALSFEYINAAFSRTSRQLGAFSADAERIWLIERQLDEISIAVQNFVMTGERSYWNRYETARNEADRALAGFPGGAPAARDGAAPSSLVADLDLMKTKVERVFSLRPTDPRQRMLATDLLAELDSLQLWMKRDIEKYQQANAAQMGIVLEQLHRNNLWINVLLLAILITSLGALFAFVLYFHRKVSVPLLDLWEGTEEISRGNLDYQVQVHGENDIARLGERFNEMAHRLRVSYADLEQKLYERTHELASLDAVALTLSRAGTLKDVLDKSLLRIVESLSGIDPKGGIFLCEPDGEVLRLVTSRGLSPEFVQQESEIRMGECLCGIAAQNGELLYTGHGCDDPRHTRPDSGEDHSHIIIPIKSRGIVLGVVFLYPQKDFQLKPSDVQMLDAMGVQLGMAVENFRFYAEVKESSEKYWDLFENATDILFTMDASGRLTAVNKAAETFSGYSKVELTGKSIFDFLSPGGAEAARRLLHNGFKTRGWTEFEVAGKEGGPVFIEASARKLIRNRQFAGYQVTARDVTEQKRMREMLVQAERLGAIGQVVVTVRHEINNPLTTVIGNTELLMERYGEKDPEMAARLEAVLSNAIRIAEIVKQLEGIRKDRVVEYLKGIPMTDLKQE